MRKEETKQLLTLLQVAYPNSYKGMGDEEKKATLAMYYDFFKDVDTPIVVGALKNYIRKNQYPPTVAGLQEQIDLINPQEAMDVELWCALAKACRNSYYNSQEEFEKLPEACRRWVCSPADLKELGQIDIGTFNTVIRSNFLRTIGQIVKSAEAQKGLSQEVKAAITESKQKLLYAET